MLAFPFNVSTGLLVSRSSVTTTVLDTVPTLLAASVAVYVIVYVPSTAGSTVPVVLIGSDDASSLSSLTVAEGSVQTPLVFTCM